MRKIKIIFTLFLMLCSGVLYAEKVNYNVEKKNIVVTTDQPQFTIQLTSNPTTGYRWNCQYDKTRIQLIKHVFLPSISQLIGAAGMEMWVFEMLPKGFSPAIPQNTKIYFRYTRPWESQSTDPLVFTVDAKVVN